MVVYAPNTEFCYVSANWPGSIHDTRVLRNSSLFQRMQGWWRPILKGVILGNSGYPLLEWLMTPLQENNKDDTSAAYNEAHEKRRRLVENALGILKEKFPCFNQHFKFSVVYAANIFNWCTALCNIARKEDILVNNEQSENCLPCPTSTGLYRRVIEIELSSSITRGRPWST